ncbi:ATP-binding protein [Shimia sp. Alg240-R146]|uniref:ATP-binding protein n=1 Tax=Shimia sp. Alg240-R146 TaxID=2993449 RepID=UPI0022E15ACB|nr:ATP-binding protein [Shimia sp. Alg240-R146]
MTENFNASVLEAVPLPAFFVDANARIIDANARAVALQPQASENRPLILVFRQPALNDAVEKCLRTRQPQRSLYLHSDARQEHRYEVLCSPIAGGGGMICFRDVTEERQLDQMRRDFVANVSHELRTPLTAILGFIETLQGPAKNDPVAQDRFLTTMSNEASRMNRLVGDLLSLSKVEEVSRMRPTDPVDLCGIVASAVQNLSPLAEENGSTLIFEPKSPELTVPGDADQLLQVVTNLIENAIKYGGQGTNVTLTMDELPRAIGVLGPAVRLTIRDDGPGIDDVHLPRLTERFYRIDSHRSREKGGTGLGLAIVKHIINRHRGRLEIESVLGEGTEISVFLPIN